MDGRSDRGKPHLSDPETEDIRFMDGRYKDGFVDVTILHDLVIED